MLWLLCALGFAGHLALSVSAAWGAALAARGAVVGIGYGERCLWASLFLVLVGTLLCLLWSFAPWGRKRPAGLLSLERDRLPQFWETLERAALFGPFPQPSRVVLVEEADAFASYDGGLPGVLAEERKLSVGLPLLYGLSLEELELVLRHELAHFRDKAGMKACSVSFELEGALNRSTHGLSQVIRKRIVDTQNVTASRVAGLCFLALCSLPLRLVFDLLVPSIAKARRELYLVMESRADAAAASAVGSEEELSSARNRVERLAKLVGSTEAQGASLLRECRRASKATGRSKATGCDWEEIDSLFQFTGN